MDDGISARNSEEKKSSSTTGEELETQNGFSLKPQPLKDLCRGKISVGELTEADFSLDITQKGVDMRIGLDIASLAERGLVNQIIIISGDSDFVPAAKHARRSGIDFILDPLWARVSASLNEHVDGVRQCVSKPPKNKADPLHQDYEPAVHDDNDEDEL
ncbi:NYN domain-containing protein [Corynebacterium auris]|uniref:NYN domain-containing protein n=1 Tax=Corynebacterium auris TaxID=44750 RepID=UPI0025B58768|nr:NYN domain-containing protein [Corynebacterium auris]